MKKLALLCCVLVSCSTKQVDRGVYEKSRNVDDVLTQNIYSPWRVIRKENSDYVLENKLTKSLFVFNSACRRNESSTLDNLTSSLVTGLDNVTVYENKKITFQDREASVMKLEASLDGVKRYLYTLTTLKNYCIYDYSLISTSLKNLDADMVDFDKFKNFLILK